MEMLADRFRPDSAWTTKIIVSPQLRENESHLVSIMRRSRELRDDPVRLFELQAEMANEVVHLQQSERAYRSQTEAADSGTEGWSDPRLLADICRVLAHVIKVIGDGIAWRALDYDRVVLHELAFAPQSGHLSRDTVIQEATEAAMHLTETGELVVLTGITNFLRYGDFVSVSDEGIGVHEVKAGKGSAKSGRSTRQRGRTRDLIAFLERGERNVGSETYRLVRLRAKPKSHIPTVAKLCRIARSQGMAHGRLSDALAAEVIDVQIMAEQEEPGSHRFQDPFSQSGDAGLIHSMNHFGRFSPNVAPYSVFPFEDDDRVGAITGGLWLITYINQGNIVRCLRRRGLRVRVPTDDELRRGPKNLAPGQIKDHEFDNPIVISNGAATWLIPLGDIGRLAYEFIDEETFADAAEELLGRQAQREAFTYSAFEDEASLWD